MTFLNICPDIKFVYSSRSHTGQIIDGMQVLMKKIAHAFFSIRMIRIRLLCGRVTVSHSKKTSLNPLTNVRRRILGDDGDAFMPLNKAESRYLRNRRGFPGIMSSRKPWKLTSWSTKKFFATSFCLFLLASVISEHEWRDHNRVSRSYNQAFMLASRILEVERFPRENHERT